ncbi:MAG TPA: thioester reductase domain-containing protein, partial [Solirubrobacteraceae bacterium]|nr:thioester reductase domain-containing protein [Solirubrobacteraceae bacterium]
RALGAEVEVAAVDVTDRDATTALVDRLASDDGLPLRGVVHAAGVSDPQFARDVEPDRFRAVWAPKVTGAWILHEATKEKDLDLFVCLSSVAATWGSQHLASYSAANAFLDTLAHTRRAQGLPALTVAWGPWALPSGLFDGEVLAFMESIGLRQLAPAQCLDLLGRLQAAGDTETFVCAADWSTYGPVMEARRPRPRLRDLVAQHEQQSSGDAALLAKLEGADGDERERILLRVATEAVADVLQLKPDAVDPDGEVFQLGLDSLMVMEIVGRLRALLGIELRPSELFDRASARAWAAHLATRVAGDENAASTNGDWTTPDKIAEDAHLADDVVPVAPAPSEPPAALRDVLLTGATGFVGVFVLAELLTAGAERVRCLVRADDEAAGLERIEANAAQYLELPHDWRERTHVVLGDLGAPGLGVEDLDHLISEADAVLHVGAGVNFAHPYERLRAPNVQGTEELLRACGKHGTPLHHVSTYGIWGLPTDGRDVIREGDDIATAGKLITGYVQTKWAAERLALDAAARGVPVACHRLGRVLGDARTGAALTTHFTLRVIKGCIQLGAAPDMDDLDIEMTPVDYVAKALVHLAKTTAPKEGDVFHLVNQRHMPFATLVDHLRARGWALETLDPHTWYERLESALGNEPNELHPVMDTVRELVVGGERAIVYDDTRARQALSGSGITCPPLDRQLLDTYLDRLVLTEYLPPVPAASV